MRNRVEVLTSPIDIVDSASAIRIVAKWAATHESRYVCICNAHSVVTAAEDPKFHTAISEADMATPDGAPVAWMMRKFGSTAQARVSGPDLMEDYLADAAGRGEAIGLYGSTPTTLANLQRHMLMRWPQLNIACAISPPFRPLSEDEDALIVNQINTSGARTLWVSLGCPKQELWMAEHRGRVQAVMLGVGAAFDFHAGTVSRAPKWMRDNGFEWLHRLFSEPNRLWRRYLITNTKFLLGASRQLFRKKRPA